MSSGQQTDAPTTTSISTERDWMTVLSGESLVFGLLGRALYAEPDRAWLQKLADDDVFAGSPFGESQPDVRAGLAVLQAWSRTWRNEAPSASFDDLRADYARLLIGPGRMLASPWESTYFNDERLVFQWQTLQVRAWYHRYGLEAANLHKEPDDHIGLELSFLAHLAQRGLQALAQRDDTVFDDALEAQRAFLSEHVLRWAPMWSEQVLTHARTDFFKGIALLTRGALAELAAQLQLDTVQEVRR